MKKTVCFFSIVLVLLCKNQYAAAQTIPVDSWDLLQEAIAQKHTYIKLTNNIDAQGAHVEIDYVLYLDGNGKTIKDISFEVVHANIYIVGETFLLYENYTPDYAFLLQATGSATNRSQLFLEAPLIIEGDFRKGVFYLGDRGHLNASKPVAVFAGAVGNNFRAVADLNGYNGSFTSTEALTIACLSPGMKAIASTGSGNKGLLSGTVTFENVYRGMEISGQDQWEMADGADIHIILSENGQEGIYVAQSAVLTVGEFVTWQIESTGRMQAGAKILGTATLLVGNNFHFYLTGEAAYGLLQFSSRPVYIGENSHIVFSEITAYGLYANHLEIERNGYFFCVVEGPFNQSPAAIFTENKAVWAEGAELYLKSNFALFGGNEIWLNSPKKLQGQSSASIMNGSSILHLIHPQDFDLKIYPVPMQPAAYFDQVDLKADESVYLWKDVSYYHDQALHWADIQNINTQGIDVFIPGDIEYPFYQGQISEYGSRLATKHDVVLLPINIIYRQNGQVVFKENLSLPVGAVLTLKDVNIPLGYEAVDPSFSVRITGNEVIWIEVATDHSQSENKEEGNHEIETPGKDLPSIHENHGEDVLEEYAGVDNSSLIYRDRNKWQCKNGHACKKKWSLLEF